MKWKRSHVQTSFVALPQITSQMKSDCFLKFFSHPSAVNTCRCDNRYKDLTDLFQKKKPFQVSRKISWFCLCFILFITLFLYFSKSWQSQASQASSFEFHRLHRVVNSISFIFLVCLCCAVVAYTFAVLEVSVSIPGLYQRMIQKYLLRSSGFTSIIYMYLHKKIMYVFILVLQYLS